MWSAAVDAAEFFTMVVEEFCVAGFTPPLFDVMGFANALSAIARAEGPLALPIAPPPVVPIATEAPPPSAPGSADVGLDGGAGRRRAPSSSAKRSAADFVRR